MKFEGEDVGGGFGIVLRQFRGEIETPLTLGEKVELRVTARVAGVSHDVGADDAIERMHVVKVLYVEVTE